MAGRAASQAVTRYSGIQVQTSSLGLQIPVGWGTFRCKCNLVDYLDFTSKAQKAASGKGGATVTGYSYSATIILAVCEGPIDSVTQVWVDSNNYANGSVGSGIKNTGSTSALAQAGLSLNAGAIGQAPWSYLTTAHQDHAIGYSGLAIVHAENYALDSSASTPNHSFEVVRTSSFGVGSTPDADPSLVVADFFQNTRTGVPGWASGLLGGLTAYQNYTLAAGLLVSPVIDQERSASDFMTELLLATNSTCVWSEGLLKFIPYGDASLAGNGKTYTPNNTPAYSLNDDDFIVDSDGDPPLLCDVEDQSDAYNVVQLEYLDRGNSYNMAIALASDAANVAQYGMRRQDPTTVHCICTPSVAAISAQLYLQRTLYIRAQYRFKLSWAFALLEPGDLLELTDAGVGLSAYMVRIIQIDEDETGGLSLTCQDYPIGVSNAPLYTMQAGVGTQTNKSVDPGGVEANLLLQSNALSTSPWSASNLTVTSGATTNPITGAGDALKLLPTTTNGLHLAAQSVTLFGGASYTFTCYLQADGYNFAGLELSNGTDVGLMMASLTGGGVEFTTVLGAAQIISATAEQVPSTSWYRLRLTAALPSGAAASVIVFNNSGNESFAGDGTSAVYAWGAQLTQGVDERVYASTTTAISGPQIFNPPSTLTQGGLETWCALAGGQNFGGADVWVSLDGGGNYSLVATASFGSARYGALTASFASGSDPDITNTCSIDLSASSGTLDSAADAVADANGTLCLIDNELISFSTATLTNPNRYNLTTYTRRGCQGTAIAAHSAGAEIIRLDDACVALPFLSVQAGVSALVKFQPFNLWGLGQPSLSDCIAYPFMPATVAAGSGSNGQPTNSVGGELNATKNTGALSNLNAVDPSTNQVLAKGSVPPTVAAMTFSYTATTTSITVSWPSFTLYRADGTTISVTSGSQSITSLTANTIYRIYGYVADTGGSTGTVAFVSGGTGSSGTPAIAYSLAGGAAAAAQQNAQANISLGVLVAATPSSGSSSGGGAGGGGCLHPSQRVEHADGRFTEARWLKAGDLIAGPAGGVRVARIERETSAEWIEVETGDADLVVVTPSHRFLDAASGDLIAARDLGLGALLRAASDHAEVTGLRYRREAEELVRIELEAEPHLYCLGSPGLLSHNGYNKY